MTVAFDSDVNLTVEIAFGYAPLVTPVWTDVSAYARSFAISRGRSHELDTMPASTMSMTLSNADGRFDPSYTSGAYNPNVLPMVPVRVRAVYNSVTYNLFRGFVEAWPQLWPALKDATVELRAVDASKLLSRAHIINWTTPGLPYPVHIHKRYANAGSTIASLLTDVGWPLAWRDLAAGDINSTNLEITTSETMLDLARNISAAENGLFFIAGDGDATFQAGNLRAAASVAATFGDSGSELRYTDLKLGYDDHQIWNRIEVDRENGVKQVSSDATSQTAYGLRTLRRTSTFHTKDVYAKKTADLLLARYKDPHVRVDSITVEPRSNPSGLWPQALGAEISDKYTVKRRPPAGNTVTQNVFVEGVTHRVDAQKNWTTTFGLSQYA